MRFQRRVEKHKVRYLWSSRKTRTIEGKNDHKKTFPNVVRDVIRISDIVLEVLDARFIEETRNIPMEDEVKSQGKILIYVINKTDLVNPKELKENPILKELFPYVLFSCRERKGSKELRKRIKIELKRSNVDEKFKRSQVGIIGYPNTGKSSLINILAGRNYAPTSSQAGFTKGIQRIKLSKNILLLDAPGIIPEDKNSNRSKEDLKHEAKVGVRTYDKVKEPEFIVMELMKDNPGLFESFYGISAEGDSEILLTELGKKLKLLKKGGEIDLDRAARMVLKDWQAGKIKVQ